MFHGGAKRLTERFKFYTEVPKNPRGLSNVPRRCQIFHERVKCSTEVLNDPRKLLNLPRRPQIFCRGCQMLQGGGIHSTERVK